MAAEALRGIRGLAALDKTGVSTPKLASALILISFLTGLLGIILMGELPADSLLAIHYSHVELVLIALTISVLAGVSLSIPLALARAMP